MSEQTDHNQRQDNARAAAAAPRAAPGVPIRDMMRGRLAARLGRLDPRARAGLPTPVRGELVRGHEALEQRRAWWRALTGAAEPANPALDPDAVLAALAGIDEAEAPDFLCLWHESRDGEGLRERDMIGFVALARTRLGPFRLPAAAGWMAPGWRVATPLIHRRHQDAAARALAGWLAERASPYRALTLRDLAENSTFAATLMAEAGAIARPTRRTIAALALPGRLPAPADTVLRHGHALTAAALESSLALAALWAGDLGPAGEETGASLLMARHRHLGPARRHGRAIVAEALIGGHVGAIVLAVRSGATVAIVAASANPRRDAGAREDALGRALAAIATELGRDRRNAQIQAGATLPATLEAMLSERRALVDLMVPAPGIAGHVAGALAGLRG